MKDLKVQVHADQWAHEIINYSYRDQLSFNWAAWYTKTPITYLNEHIYIKDTENETSNYFFLPWPKHNNNHVNQQVRECLANRKKKAIVSTANVQEVKPKSKLDEFEEQYREFVFKLKQDQTIKKSIETNDFEEKFEEFRTKMQQQSNVVEEIPNKDQEQSNTNEPNSISVVEIKRKRGRPRKNKVSEDDIDSNKESIQ